ncbi:hypothetical protein HQ585_00795 [candidate division KSB1 bacterium]|nr:hypothetical protein [candidate division KSB1 bacterium]
MKKSAFFGVMLLSLIVTGLFAGDITNFSGTWTFDDSKLGATEDMPRGAATKIVVKQEDNSFSSERFISSSRRGDYTLSETLTLDGEECVSETESSITNSTAVWSEDKKVLTIKSTTIRSRDGQDFEILSTELWSLEEKDAVLKIESSRETPRGLRESVMYYTKNK